MYQFEEEFAPSENQEHNAKIFFQVVIDYNLEFIKTFADEGQLKDLEKIDAVDAGPLESQALQTYDEADELASNTVTVIHNRFPGSIVRQLEPEDQEDEYHVLVYHEKGSEIAKIGVIAIDYSDVTIH